jgi:hypothetical protein
MKEKRRCLRITLRESGENKCSAVILVLILASFKKNILCYDS